MKKMLIIPLCIMWVTACLEPPHDNEYDPQNPEKAYLAGTVYDHHDNELQGAQVALVQDSQPVYGVDSDIDGDYELEDIDPGLYTFAAKARYYRPVELDTIEIYAGLYEDTIDVFFQEIFFDFENTPLGTVQPLGFEVRHGYWSVIEDHQEPGVHSVPNVYRGITDSLMLLAIAVFHEPLDDFWFESEVKVADVSGSLWETGLVLRYQDFNNHYILRFGAHYLKLYKIQGGSSTLLAENLSVMFGLNQYYYLAVECSGAHIKVMLEENVIFEVDDLAFSNGYVGLWVASEAGWASVYFDDISIWP